MLSILFKDYETAIKTSDYNENFCSKQRLNSFYI